MHQRDESPGKARSDSWIALFRFGDRDYMEALLTEGIVYMNTAAYFATHEMDEAGRGDPNEAVSFSFGVVGTDFSFQDPRHGREFRQAALVTSGDPIQLNSDTLAACNVYCMTCFPEGEFELHPRLREFGDCFVAFTNAREFFRRFKAAAQREGQETMSAPVEYVDIEQHRGALGLFRKKSELSFQREWRLVAVPGNGGSKLVLKLGDLTDIAYLGKTPDSIRVIRP